MLLLRLGLKQNREKHCESKQINNRINLRPCQCFFCIYYCYYYYYYYYSESIASPNFDFHHCNLFGLPFTYGQEEPHRPLVDTCTIAFSLWPDEIKVVPKFLQIYKCLYKYSTHRKNNQLKIFQHCNEKL